MNAAMRAARAARRLDIAAAILIATTTAGSAGAASVSGRAVTPNGVGIPGIDIDVINAVTGENLVLLDDDTDTDGSFDFEVPDGRYLVRFEAAPGQPLVSLEFPNWLLQGFIADWTVTMEIGYLLTGHVRGPSGEAVVGAGVRLFREDLETDVYSPTDETLAGGAFQIIVPPGAPIELTIKPPAGTSYLGLVTSVGAFGANTDIGDLELETGFRVSGRVVSGGGGVDRVNLDAFAADGTPIPLGHDKTDGLGDYEIVLPAGEFELVASPRTSSGLAPARSSTFSVTGNRTVPDIPVQPGRRLEGRITDPTGTGVGNVRLSLWVPGGDMVDVSGGETNPAGDYELVALPGVYDVMAEPPAFTMLGTGTRDGVSLLIDARLDMTLDPSSTPILGVTDFVAEHLASGVRCRWRASHLGRITGFRLSRIEPSDGLRRPIHPGWIGPTTDLPGFSFEGNAISGRFSMTDRDPVDGGRYLLEALMIDGEVQDLGPIEPVGTGSQMAVSRPGRLLVSPNPVLEQARITILAPESAGGAPESGAPRLDVFDATGRRVLALVGTDSGMRVSGGFQWDIPARSLPAGIYLVRAQSGGYRMEGKLLRVR